MKREDKGLVRRFLAKLTGRSRAQIARLIHCYREGREVQPGSLSAASFSQFAIPGWISNNWASVDEAHQTLSGPATQKILERAWHEFREPGYERLARLSVAQL